MTKNIYKKNVLLLIVNLYIYLLKNKPTVRKLATQS